MENQVSPPVLRWQPALTTPPLVVLLLYLQNAQLSFKPALCLQEPGRQGGGLRGGEDKGWEGKKGERKGGDEQLRARRSLCVLWYCRPSNIYSTNCLMRRDALLRADEGQVFQRPPSKDDVCSASFDSRAPPPVVARRDSEEREASLCKQPVVAGALLTNVTKALWAGDTRQGFSSWAADFRKWDYIRARWAAPSHLQREKKVYCDDVSLLWVHAAKFTSEPGVVKVTWTQVHDPVICHHFAPLVLQLTTYHLPQTRKCPKVSLKTFTAFTLTKFETQSWTAVSGLAAFSPTLNSGIIPSISVHARHLIHM